MPLVHHPVELARPERQLDPKLGTKREGMSPQGPEGDVLDVAALNQRDDILAQIRLGADVRLAPAQTMSQHSKALAEPHVVHVHMLIAAAHRALS
ncbi:MAG TPA: hypothetical protein VI277_07180 [Candidatus Limnocylindria bacterium]